MSNESEFSNDMSYIEGFSSRVLKNDQLLAVTEATTIMHVAKFGEQPLCGIPIVDALKDMGPCPCIQCFRDEFIS